MTDRNPQAAQMADESMLRNLAAQAEAIWPQEKQIIQSYGLPSGARVLDVGCGSGEAILRQAEMLTEARFLGIDVHEPHVAMARERCLTFGDRVEFRVGDAFSLDLEDDSFDLVLCRHVLQALPEPELVLAEMARVTRPGGRLHIVAEDYAMIHFHPTDVDIDRFFREGPSEYAQQTGTDLRSGRKVPFWLHNLGLEQVRVDYAIVDTERVPRGTLANIFVAWRDGYADALAQATAYSLDEVLHAFNEMIACIREREGYAVWQLPIVHARVPTASR